MVIKIIRHAKVNFTWNKRYNSVDYDIACKEYDNSSLESIKKQILFNSNEKIFISTLKRTHDTAKLLFGDNVFIRDNLFDEVPLKSFKDTDKSYPLWMWNIAGRMQWLTNNTRQIESRKETQERAEKAINIIESIDKDCYVITHGFYMITLIKVLKKQGYKIKRRHSLGINNLEEIRAEK